MSRWSIYVKYKGKEEPELWIVCECLQSNETQMLVGQVAQILNREKIRPNIESIKIERQI